MDRFSLRGLVLLDGELVPGAVVVAHGQIETVVREGPAALIGVEVEAPIIAPGFFDLQVNGGFGIDVQENPAAIQRLAERLPETGVTSFLPTIITSPRERYLAAFDAFDSARPTLGARPLG